MTAGLLLLGNESCVTPFGYKLGTDSTGIDAYSNCREDFVSNEDNWTPNGAVYTGMKWQCVEYARRWLVSNLQYTFGSVDIAAQIWALPELTDIRDPSGQSTVPFVSYPADETDTCPHVGCLLVYDTDLVPTGHVAVVVGVNGSATPLGQATIAIAEQNLMNEAWPHGASASRLLAMAVARDGKCSLADDHLLGWKCAAAAGALTQVM